MTVEFWEVHDFEPKQGLGPRFAPEDQLNHVALLVDDVEAEAKRLEQLGYPEILRIRIGEMPLRLHDVPGLGHMIEVQPDSDLARGFMAELAAAADQWDGSEPLRSAAGLPSLQGTAFAGD